MKRIQTVALNILFFGLVVLWTAANAFADGIIADALSPISAGRGGTNLAQSDNASVLVENPAGMAWIPNNSMFDLGMLSLFGKLRYSNPRNKDIGGNFSFPENPGTLPQIGLILSVHERVRIGVGAYATAGYGTDFDLVSPFAGPQTYRSFAAVAKIAGSAAVKVSDRLSVGTAIGLAVNHTELETPFFFQTGGLAGAPYLADLRATGYAPTWTLGMSYKADERTTFGAAYTDEIRFELEGKADVTLFIPPAPVASSFDAKIGVTIPRSVGVGVRHEFNNKHAISADGIWFNWKSAWNRLDLQFSNSTNPVFAGTTVTDTIPLDWRNTTSVKLGYEWQLTKKQVVRTGYVFHSSPVPDATLIPLIPATLEHAVTAGHSFAASGKLRFNSAFIYTFGPKRIVGSSMVVGGDFAGSSLRARYPGFSVGVSRSF